MIEVRQAFADVLSCQLRLKTTFVALEDSYLRTLAEDIFSDIDQPPFHRVAMDGIAINKDLLSSTRKFEIIGVVAAGSSIVELPAGEVCFEVMTGAVLPSNANLVVRYEDLKIINGFAEVVVDIHKLSSNFHEQGSDYHKGDRVIFSNTVIKSTTTAILASVGCTHVKVYDLPRIAILSTGEELVEIGEKPKPYQIRWSNGICLRQELLSHGFSNISLHIVGDSESEMNEIMQKLLISKDVLLLTGGVSAGKYDFVPKLLKECKVNEIFHKVAQRPGKPLWFGRTASDVVVFGLPGNPVSCLVNLRRYVVPFLRHSVPAHTLIQLKAFLGEDISFIKNLTYYCLVKIKNKGGKIIAYPLKGNGSGDFFQLRDSDGFIELHPEDSPFAKGFLCDVYLWGNS